MRRMATFGSLVLAGLAAASQLVAQGATAAPAPAPARKAMFWKVSSAGQRCLAARVDSPGVRRACIRCRRKSEDAFEQLDGNSS